jgi:hypothetical protein
MLDARKKNKSGKHLEKKESSKKFKKKETAKKVKEKKNQTRIKEHKNLVWQGISCLNRQYFVHKNITRKFRSVFVDKNLV